ncbi:MAG: hypothetical protein H6609_18030 [Ignavibacteriales bacterium]|nr:hypothetical protein [Ignavibacteriales bacterium]
MKKIIFISIIFLFANEIFAQNYQDKINLYPFGFGLLGGINTSSFISTSFIIEGRLNLIPNLNSKMSIGYSTLYKNGYHVNTNYYSDFENRYGTVAYDIDRFRYSTIPISLGLEYIFTRQKFTPYTTFDVGYNFYEYKTEEINYFVGKDGYYDSFNQLPELYKNQPPKIVKDQSYRFAIGVGTLYKLGSTIFLDIRYAYQINTNLVNTHQFLIGIQI